jgi:hypothetical protein
MQTQIYEVSTPQEADAISSLATELLVSNGDGNGNGASADGEIAPGGFVVGSASPSL